MFIIINYIYFGSIFAMGSLKGSMLFNTIILNIFDLMGYLLVDIVCSNVKKRTFYLIDFSIIFMTVFGFHFFPIPDNCDGCYQQYFSLFFLALIRICAALNL